MSKRELLTVREVADLWGISESDLALRIARWNRACKPRERIYPVGKSVPCVYDAGILTWRVKAVTKVIASSKTSGRRRFL